MAKSTSTDVASNTEYPYAYYFRTFAALLKSFNDQYFDEPEVFAAGFLSIFEYLVYSSLERVLGIETDGPITGYLIPFLLLHVANLVYFYFVKQRMLGYVERMTREQYLRNRRDGFVLLGIVLLIFTAGYFF